MSTKTSKPLNERDTQPDANPDPLTGEHGSHPIGTGLGSAGAAAAGAAVGAAVGGPVGAVAGGIVGAVAGGAAGHAAGEALDPTVETDYWRENYQSRPYYKRGTSFSDYEPAYRYGWESAVSPAAQRLTFEDFEPTLARDWRFARGEAPNEWADVKGAARDAWDRVRARRS
jgi:hypothetical protein